VQTLGDTFDYNPPPIPPHSFLDLASDVVIDGDVAWIVGMSKGKHDENNNDPNLPARHPRADERPHRQARRARDRRAAGQRLAAERVLRRRAPSRGRRRDRLRLRQDLLEVPDRDLALRVDGERTWFEHEATNSGLAYGSDVALDSQGRALVAGAVTQNGKLRGYVFGRKVDVLGPVAVRSLVPRRRALGGARHRPRRFDRIFPAGYITVNGETAGPHHADPRVGSRGARRARSAVTAG
jgi:hypothetical protein